MDTTPKDKRVKREIANSNERRRMQSINAGFQKLRRLLPVSNGEKLSKAAILQHAAEFIQQIKKEQHNQSITSEDEMVSDRVTSPKSGLVPITSVAEIASDRVTSPKTGLVPITSVSEVINDRVTSPKTGLVPISSVAELVSDRVTSPKTGLVPTTSVKAEIVSDRVTSPKNGLVSTGVAKAAIALPLEVPYTSETAIGVDQHHQDPVPKGQNLDTICKAIMEIEGDRVFNNENMKQNKQEH